MKTKKQSQKNKVKKQRPSFFRKDDALAVLRDVSNGKEYYLSIIDSFSVRNKEYVVMYNYEPDDGNHSAPEFVIMRSEYSDRGSQCFYSITDGRELDMAYAIFAERFTSKKEKSGNKR